MKKWAGKTSSSECAIIGLSVKISSCSSYHDFWKKLLNEESLIEEMSEERWELHNESATIPWGERKQIKGMFLDDIDAFDRKLFKLSKGACIFADPRQRLLLESCWSVIEDAGLKVSDLKKQKVGVFIASDGFTFGSYFRGMSEKDLSNQEFVIPGNSTSFLANRISYLLDFKGPSMVIDSTCSSVYVALHHARLSLERGECDYALVGGVTIFLEPWKSGETTATSFESSNSEIKSFSKEADGYRSSEGCGAILLQKNSPEVRQAHDCYAILTGSAYNSGGKTASFAKPSQEQLKILFREVLHSAQLSSSEINYIETHGISSQVGDAIEANALIEVFGDNPCYISTIKPNIGHAHAASGMYSLLKAILAMKYHKIPAIKGLQGKGLNEGISSNKQGITFLTEPIEWSSTEKGPGRHHVLLNSYGFSNVNAAIILREPYPEAQDKKEYHFADKAIICLSAESKEQVYEQMERLSAYIKEREGLAKKGIEEELDCHELAYTLQLGREAMKYRWAALVGSVSELETILKAEFSQKDVEKKKKGKDIFWGDPDKKDPKLEKLKSDRKALDEILVKAFKSKNYNQLAKYWTGSINIKWAYCYGNKALRRLHLPGYPFERKKYWLQAGKNDQNQTLGKLHPLLHENSSNLQEQKFTSIYTGEENFLTDHKVRGEKVLPGTAYLELAREAGSRSSHKEIVQLKNVGWLSPISVSSHPKKIHIRLFDEGDNIVYEIYSENKDKEEIVHGQGKMRTTNEERPDAYDLERIKKRLSQSEDIEVYYGLFKEKGLSLGPTFQGIKTFYYDDKEALSRISLPKKEGFVLQPGILDSALQTCMASSFKKNHHVLSLPFSVREVNIYDELPQKLWCYAKKNKTHKEKANINTYDIELLNEKGEILLNFKDFMVLPLDKPKEKSKVTGGAALHLYTTSWRERSAIIEEGVSERKGLILLAGGSVSLAGKLQESVSAEVLGINAGREIDYFMSILKKVQEVLKKREPYQFILLHCNSDYLDYGFISGLFKTSELEHPRFKGKLVGVESLSLRVLDELSDLVSKEQHTACSEVRYRGKLREEKVIDPLSIDETSHAALKIKEGGVYLITGGAGGLGMIFADYINKTTGTKIILTGRRKLSQEKQRTLQKIQGAEYYTCDITDEKAVSRLIASIKEKYGKLDGIIHSAGVIRDSFLLKKTEKEAMEVLLPKVVGAKNLDGATKDEALDFMIYFSSMAAVLGNVGQGDYASANAWLDAYADFRNELVGKRQRKGHTLSINWPLWQEGGMQVDIESEKWLEKKYGMRSLPTQEGLLALETLFNQRVNQGIVTYGLAGKITLAPMPKKRDTHLAQTENTKAVQNDVEEYLVALMSDLLKLDKEDIEVDVDFSNFGVDSIMMMKLLNVLEEKFEVTLEPTAVMNYPTIERLATYLQEEISVSSLSANLTAQSTEPQLNMHYKKSPATASVPMKRKRFSHTPNELPGDTKVAIIGMSCRLPGSDGITSFWNNLSSGKDLITDTPRDRWDASSWYSLEPAPDKTYTIKGGFISNPGLFDASYFKISVEDAIAMDPQQRLMLELSRDMLAHAGYEKQEMAGTDTGVYIGAKDNNYLRNNYHLLERKAFQHTIVSSISNMIAARISDFYDLKAASQVIDTACSSSLVAIHEACEAITAGKLTMAIAGGVYLMTDPFFHIGFSQAEVLSKDGKSYVFDERANGFVMGEGGALVLLKNYEQAKRDGDQIFGVIVGSATNNDGQTAGLTVPNKEGQKQVIEKALHKAQISPERITYYEAHGTGTLLGDPIEVKAATEVYQSKTGSNGAQYCAIGAVKSNLGHNMMAAGVTGLIKILLQMQHGQLVPTLHCESPHPRFKFHESPFYPNTMLKDWESVDSHPRTAAISSFGFGGTNCHMIIQETDKEKLTIKRRSLPVERLSSNYYWLGQEVKELTNQTAGKVSQTHTSHSFLNKQIIYNEALMRDHQIFGRQVLIGAAYLSLSFDTAFQVYPGKPIAIFKILFSNPLVLKTGEKALLKSHHSVKNDTISVEYELNGKVNKASVCEFERVAFQPEMIDIESLKQTCDLQLNALEFYAHQQQSCYGPSLRSVQKAWYLSDNKLLASISLSKEILSSHTDFTLHPALFDACHVAATLCLYRNIDQAITHHWPPLMIKRVVVVDHIGNHHLQACYCYVETKRSNDQIAEFDMQVLTNKGEAVIGIIGFTTKSIPNEESLLSREENTEKALPVDKRSDQLQMIHKTTPSDNLQIRIQSYLQEKIGLLLNKNASKVSIDQNFMDMGLESNRMIGTSQSMEQELGIELYPTLFFEYQNIKDLASYFIKEHEAILGEKFGEAVLVEKVTPDQTRAIDIVNSSPMHTTKTKEIKPIRPLSFGSETNMKERNSPKSEDIAIIGMSGYLPNSKNLEEFWTHIETGKDLVSEIPEDHWDYRPWFDSNTEAENKTYSKWGGFLKDIDKFDPLFFGISPREAEWMDPQLRLLLQSAYHTFEDAGVINEIKGSRTGVYVGSCFHEYWDEVVRAQTTISDYQHSSSVMSSLSAGVSYHFDLQGGSIPLDNACASSMTALHLGCQALRNGEIDTGMIGGLNMLLSPLHYVYFSRIQALSPTGRCHTFDKKADGYVPGEGVVSVLIKPLTRAITDGNKIHGVIKASAINHVGKSNNPTSPRPELQTRLLLDAWKSAGINPEEISYIEAHGTGTALGDPIEINALKKAFKKHTSKEGFCKIGSTKAHIGHLEGAAGLASVIKVLLMMKHRTIPRMPNFKELNPYIKLESSPLIINTKNEAWEGSKPLLAGVSSFGMTGNNAHVVLEGYPQGEQTSYQSESPAIIVLSAKNEERLKEQIQNLKTYLEANKKLNLYDIAYTLQIGREAMEERVALIAKNTGELVEKMMSYLEGKADNCLTGNTKKDRQSFLLKGGAGQAYINYAIENKELESLAQLWVKGVAIDWHLFYGSQKPQKISLPPYPFAKERYWFNTTSYQTEEMISDSPRSSSGTSFRHSPGLAHHQQGAQTMPQPLTQKREKAVFAQTWSPCKLLKNPDFKTSKMLIISDISNKSWLNKLPAILGETALISLGDDLATKDFTTVNGLIDLTSFEGVVEKKSKWLSLLQKLVIESEQEHLKLLVVSKGAGDAGSLQGAGRFGLYEMLGAEYNKIDSLHIDLEATLDEEKCHSLILEAYQCQTSYTRLRYFQDSWHHPLLKEIYLNEASKKPLTGPVLITGGTRGLGMLCAKHLVKKHGVRQLVLMGREVFPPRESWNTEKIADTPLGRKLRDIHSLEEEGVTIEVLGIPLADNEQLNTSLAEIKRKWGNISGFIHCAGYADTDTPAFIKKEIASIIDLQTPKVEGLNNIHKILKSQDLSFGIFFSSVASLIPRLGTGQSDYTMANSYMNSFADYHRAAGYPYTSIQWPSWKETGMGEVKGGAYEALGLLSITNQEGLEVLDRVLSQTPESSVIFPAVYDIVKFDPASLLTVPRQKPDNKQYHIPSVDESDVSDWLKALLSRELKLSADRLDLDTPFSEYGVDSVLLAQLVKRIEQSLEGVSISPNVIIEYPSIGMLSAYFHEHHAEALSHFSAQTVSQSDQRMYDEFQIAKNQSIKYQDKLMNNAPIAVIGMACHFPDATHIAAFWENLQSSKDSIREVPFGRWDIDKYYSTTPQAGKSYSKWGAFIDNIEYFDPDYFGVDPKLASQIDPLERQWLEVSNEAILDAGYDKKALWGQQVGVYAGSRTSSFRQKIKDAHKDVLVGVGQNFITAHLAHLYNFKGPNMVVDTACSSSLTAIHLAVKDLCIGETDLALAGGVDILLDEQPFILLSTAEILSLDGRSKTFDESANGTGLGEGCGVLVLKRLNEAIAAGDKIYGVIEGTAVNNDGNTMGITTPNPEAQQSLIETAIANANIDPTTISYIETHGTGTLIGDPIELKGITRVLEKHTKDKGVCGVGSVKSNIGHLLSAAGIAGMIKTLLAITAKQLPPTLHCHAPNPRFDFATSSVYPVTSPQNWEGVKGIRRAGVSAFGLGGNNAHVLLSDAGIPVSNRAKLPFISPSINYQRKYYWPDNQINKEIDIGEAFEKYLNANTAKKFNDWIVTFTFDHENYILRDHRIQGIRVIPGVTYLDLVLRYAEEIFGEHFGLSKVLFVTPLATADNFNRRVEVHYCKASYKVTVRSQRVDGEDTPYGEWDIHMHCRLVQMEQAPETHFDVSGFITGHYKNFAVDDIYLQASKVSIRHGDFMQTKGTIYQKGEEELMHLHLSKLAESYRGAFLAHPAFLDGSTFAGSSFGVAGGKSMLDNGFPYIPFSIDSFVVFHTLPEELYVYSKKVGLPDDKIPEVLKNDIYLYNLEGELLAYFKGLTTKRIRQPELISQLIEEKSSLDTGIIVNVTTPTGVAHASTPPIRQLATSDQEGETIKLYLREVIGVKTGKQLSSLDDATGFYDLGLDSKQTLAVVEELEAKCGHDFYPTLLFEHQTIEELTAYLLKKDSIHFKGLEGTEKQGKDTIDEHIPKEQDVGDSIEFESSFQDKVFVRVSSLTEPIAIIGMSGKYPGAANLEEFWVNLKKGKNSITEIPKERWDPSTYFDSEKGKPGKSYCKWGGFISDVDKFDPLFFNISPREAQNMDPQVRLFLEESWKALEDGGYTRKQLSTKERVGVFAGAFWTDYQLYRVENHQTSPSSFVSAVANSVSYHFGFHGPSIGLDTQCSSSLTAIHLACDSIRKGESTMALAGGVNLSLHPSKYNWLSSSMFLSTKGRCESFGEGADGYVPGEGVGVVILKSLSRAEEDGDLIYGVIKGTAINHGGKSSGLTVPNPKAQSMVIKEAMKEAGVAAEDFSYIEAHGTGTSLGDPIEIVGLTNAFETDKKQCCVIGSVKSNIGHSESAAGISGLTKVLLQMKHKQLVPSLHSKHLNPNIDFANTPFRVQQSLADWEQTNGKPRIAGISSFGAGGSNAHLIVEEYKPAEGSSYESEAPAIIVLSARNEERLKEQVQNLKAYVEANKGANLYEVAYTLQTGREEMVERLAIIAKDTEEVTVKLVDYLEGKTDGLFTGNVKKAQADFLLKGNAGKSYIETAISDKEFDSLAQLWVKGVEIDWNLLYEDGNKPNKLSLPTYPFARERYWHDIHSANLSSTFSPIHPEKKISPIDLSDVGASLDINKQNSSAKIHLQETPCIPVDLKSKEIVTGVTTATKPDKEVTPEQVKTKFVQLLAGVLYIEAAHIDREEKFVDLGLDSVIGVELIKKINEYFQIDLAATDLYNNSTVDTLSHYIYERLPLSEVMEDPVLPISKTDLQSIKLIDSEAKNTLTPLEESTHPKAYSPKEKAVSAIAVIGMSGAFPGSKNVDIFWEHLKSGTNLVREVAKDRWDMSLYYDEDSKAKGKTYSKWMGALADVDQFDPLFFNLSPKEAELMDPQQRLFLEQGWKAIEDGGYSPKSLSDSNCGVFIGVGQGDYHTGDDRVTDLESYTLTGSSSSILSARISYLLNLKGPCMAIDTSCSSSLVAVAQACDSIILGNSDIALAGGVCVLTTPRMHIMTSKAGMLSADGRCHTFDQKANGFVPGEGVGVIMLKKLEKAESDGDHIYGVIKGWGVNQDGSTNGITAPSDQSQTSLQRRIYAQFKINPETISYIEAHGTGTKLGDPIEVKALKETFKAYTNKTNYCGLGSVKSNIGHTLTTAGVAGVIKVLLSLKHKQLPPTINYDALNQHIKLEGSPFYVNTKLKDWESVNDQPCRAAVSSFGFSGTNAHVVLEEYVQKDQADYQSEEPVVILLSARNKERLKEQVQNLRAYIKANKEFNLYDVAYTLQTGREAMKERLAIIVKDTPELIEQLLAYQEGKEDNILTGNIKKSKESTDLLLSGDEGMQYLETILKNRNYIKLAQLWINGVNIDWNLLYLDTKPNKISLPTYPFARERYWITENKLEDGTATKHKLHPLVHYNSSNLKEQKFTSVFTGEERFLADHKVRGEKVLPGVAYLELARMAGTQSAEEKITQLKDVTWIRPVSVNGKPEKIHISLFENNEYIDYEVFSKNNNEEHIHSHGKLITKKQDKPTAYDIMSIKQRCLSSKNKEECYDLFKRQGLHYGKTFQGIDILYYNTEEALSKINLSKEKDFLLQPGVLDSALQTCIGLTINEKEGGLALPFSVKEVNIYKDLTTDLWCFVRKSTQINNKIHPQSYDVDLLSKDGSVLVNFRSLVVLPVNKLIENSQLTANRSLKTHLFKNTWQKIQTVTHESDAIQLILIIDGSTKLVDKLKERLTVDIESMKSGLPDAIFTSIIKKVQYFIEKKQKINILLVFQNAYYKDYGFISGLFKTAYLENPKIKGKVVGVDSLSLKNLDKLVNILKTEQGASETEVRYKEGLREVKRIEPISATGSKYKVDFKEGGIYLITGGVGGLGMIFAKHISQKVNATFILTGRSALTAEREQEVKSIKGAEYHRCDVCNKEEVISLIQKIKSRYVKLDGIIHSAGVIKDNFIQKKTKKEALAVLTPKLQGTIYLDEVTKDEKLDFMIYFSSIAGLLGNVGQADYASANAYLNNYADYRNNLIVSGKRNGHTLSINWPLWEQGGMQLDGEMQKIVEKQWGLHAIPTEQGLQAFEKLLSRKISQGVVVFGEKSKFSQYLLNEITTLPEEVKLPGNDRAKITQTIMSVCSELLKLDKNDLEMDVNFSEYGVDSIMMIKFLNMLEDRMGIILEPTTIVNYPTIELLAEYLATEKVVVVTQTAEGANRVLQPKANPLAHTLRNHDNIRLKRNTPIPTKVAIIGMSCKLPQSDNPEAYWNNLQAGKNLVTDTPSDRWGDASKHFSEELLPDKTYTTKGGFINYPGLFDAAYFNVSDSDAICMDPQQRIALELSRELVAHAGYHKKELAGRNVGVYIGAKDNSYIKNNYHLLPADAYQHTIVNNIGNMIAARISDFYNIKGPSLVIDTACSSSLVAIHEACENIISGKMNMAIAGGISILVDAFCHIGFSQAGVLSRDGKSYVFDERANGFVVGEGGGLVLLKNYQKALEDGDRILGVISGSAVNNDGHTMGLTVPDIEGQKEVIKEALDKAHISPREITYFEAHGTGTLLGDPIEVKAATEVYQSIVGNNGKRQYCAIGSVKSNLGHTMTAAGITGLVKILLQMQHNKIVPTLHCEKPHPRFQFEKSPFYPNTVLREWKDEKKIAAISSFGFGGTNCHMIIEKPEAINFDAVRLPLLVERFSPKYYWLGYRTKEYAVESQYNKS